MTTRLIVSRDTGEPIPLWHSHWQGHSEYGFGDDGRCLAPECDAITFGYRYTKPGVNEPMFAPFASEKAAERFLEWFSGRCLCPRVRI